MKIKVLILLTVLACEFPTQDSLDRLEKVEFDLNMEKNDKGFFILKLDPSKTQTIHRVGGRIFPPVEYKRFEWYSELKWNVEPYSVEVTNIRSYTNSKGEFSNVLGPMKSMKGDTLILHVFWDEKGFLDSVSDYAPNQSETFYIILE